MQFKFKIDENLPVEIAELLINAGHDAKTINEQNLQGATDPVLIGAGIIALRADSSLRSE